MDVQQTLEQHVGKTKEQVPGALAVGLKVSNQQFSTNKLLVRHLRVVLVVFLCCPARESQLNMSISARLPNPSTPI